MERRGAQRGAGTGEQSRNLPPSTRQFQPILALRDYVGKCLYFLFFFNVDLLLKKKSLLGTSLVVQWLRLRTPNVGGPGLIPGEELDTTCGN